MNKFYILICIILILFAANAFAAWPWHLYPIKDLAGPNDLTPNGVSNWNSGSVVVVGNTASSTPIRYTIAGGTAALAGISGRTTVATAKSVSANGSIIVGDQGDPVEGEADAVKFNVGSSASLIISDPCSWSSYPAKISADGTLIAAWGRIKDPVTVGGMEIVVSTGVMTKSHANAYDNHWVSADGTYITGVAAWTPYANYGYIKRGSTSYFAKDATNNRHWVKCISDDGSVGYGQRRANPAPDDVNTLGRVWTWTGSGYTVSNMPTTVTGVGTATHISVKGCEGVGRYVVGNAKVGGTWRGFVWNTLTSELTPLSSFFKAEQLADIPSGYAFELCTGISPDGTAIIGTLKKSATNERIGFVAQTPLLCVIGTEPDVTTEGNVNADCYVNFVDFAIICNNWHLSGYWPQ